MPNKYPTEFQEQQALMTWAALSTRKYPELKWLYHIPNGGSRHKLEAVNLKKAGIKAGVPDLHLPVARRGFHSIYLEMKSEKGEVSERQAEWINGLKEHGNAVRVCYGANMAIEILEWYLSKEAQSD